MNRQLIEVLFTMLFIVAGSAYAAADGACCSEVSGDLEGSEQPDDEYFVATLHCETACADGQEATTQIVRNFHPIQHGLRPGNGSDGQSAPWGGFTGTLESERCQVCASCGCWAVTQASFPFGRPALVWDEV